MKCRTCQCIGSRACFAHREVKDRWVSRAKGSFARFTQGVECCLVSDGEGGSKWKLLKTLKEKRIEEKQKVADAGVEEEDPGLFKKVDVGGKEEPEVIDEAFLLMLYDK